MFQRRGNRASIGELPPVTARSSRLSDNATVPELPQSVGAPTFQKFWASAPVIFYLGWTNPEKSRGVDAELPGLLLRDPFPHSILFEGKYFPRGLPRLA